MNANRWARGALPFLCTLVMTVGVIAGTTVDASASKTPSALVYGDSLTWESMKGIKKQFKLDIPSSVLKLHVFAASQTAPCDWEQRLPADIVKYHPAVILISTVGDSESDCMTDPSTHKPYVLNSSGYLSKYQSDLTTFFSTATNSGAHVVFSEGAPMLNANWNSAVIAVANIAQNLIASNFPTVTFSDSARLAVSANGAYAQTLPCLPSEAGTKRCINGTVDIRTMQPAIDYGIHLCPTGLSAGPCHGYSSGELRYGSRIADEASAAD